MESEFVYMDWMIWVDLSNFLVWYSRSMLILRLLDERGVGEDERRVFLDVGMLFVV